MANHVFGLDFSDRSVELVEVARKKGGISVVSAARTEVPAGVISLGVIVDQDALATVLGRLLDDAFGQRRGRLQAGISLPEMLVYSKSFTFPATLNQEMVRRAVMLEAADLFPLPLNRAATSLVNVSRGKETQEVFLAAADRSAVSAYVTVLRRVGVETLFVEAESMAVGRALLDPSLEDAMLVADIGSRTTNLSVHDRGVMRLSGNVMAAGDALSAAIERKLGVTLEEADELRKKAGFDPSVDDGRLFLVMEQPMHEIMDEMTRTIDYYQGRTGRRIGAIVLAGGTSLTPQLSDYVASNFPGIEVLSGNPLRGVSVEGLERPERISKSPVLWSSSLGLAYRAIGARGSPSIDLRPGSKEESGPVGERIKQAFRNIMNMVTKGKRTGTRKTKAKAAEPVEAVQPTEATAVSAPEPVRLQIDVAAPTAAPAEPKEAAPAVAGSAMDVLGTAVPAKEAAPIKPVTEEKDYGSGIGDILKTQHEPPKALVAPETVAAAPAQDEQPPKRSIASILEERETYDSDDVAAAAPRSGRGRTAVMAGLVLVMFLAAAAGVYMFISKNGAPEIPGFISDFFTKDEPLPLDHGSANGATTAPEVVSLTAVLSAEAAEDGAGRPVVLARMIETDVTGEGRFPATGAAVVAGAGSKSRGRATIVNESAQAYNFVATTRLLSKDGVLFRMVAGSPIPANGSVTVDVVADQPGAAGDIGPTTFTIPGLPAATQKVVYAKSDSAMTGGAATAKAVTESDLSVAKAAVADKLRVEALENLRATLAEGEALNEDLLTAVEEKVEAPTPGSAATEFTVKMTFKYKAMVLPERELTALLEKTLAETVSNPIDYRLGQPFFAVEAYDETVRKAEVRAEASVLAAE